MRRRGSRLRTGNGVEKITNKWSMNENSGTTLFDSIGGINMSYPFDLAASSVVGQVGNAVKFDLQSRNAQTAVAPSLSWIQNVGGLNKAIPFTLMFWSNESGGSFNPLMSIGSGGFYHFYIRKNQNNFNVLMQYKVNGVTNTLSYTLGTFPVGKKLITLVFDPYKINSADQLTYYADGIFSAAGNSSILPTEGSLGLESHYFTAGGFGYTGSRTGIFTGWQDEIRFAMGSILTPSEILNTYNLEK